MKYHGLRFPRRRRLQWCPSLEACNESERKLTERWPLLRACGWRRAPIEANWLSEKHFRFERRRVIAKALREISGSHRCCFQRSGALRRKNRKRAGPFALQFRQRKIRK